MSVFIPAPTAFATVPSFQSAPFVTGYNIEATGNTTFTVSPGAARALTNEFVIQYPSFSATVPGNITADISTVGLNGCYPNSIASLGLAYNRLFPVYVVTDTSGVRASGSVSANGPFVIVATGDNFLPAGVNSFRRIGWLWVSQATGYILPMAQSGNGNEREYLLNAPITAISGGTEHTTAAEIDLSATTGIVPPNRNSKVNLNVQLTAAAATSLVYLQPQSFAAATTATSVLAQVASDAMGVMVSMVCGQDATTGNAAIKYLVDNGSAVTILVAGFTDSLGNSLA